jgi:hypothetical protein
MIFNNPPLIDLEDGRFELTGPLRFTLEMGNGEIRVTVPAGFSTDFASVPRILWPIFPPQGKWNKAAILHDFLYSTSGKCSRSLADSLFREAMYQLGVPWWRRNTMYWAVRIFGSPNWRIR